MSESESHREEKQVTASTGFWGTQETYSILDTKSEVVLKLSTLDNLGDDRFVTNIKRISSFVGSLPGKGQLAVIRTAPIVTGESHLHLL